MDKRVLPLALGGLGIGTTEFTIMGLLPEIAGSLQVSIPQAGHFISAYALGVVIGAPLLVGYSVKFPPKKVLIFLMILFTIFNGLSAIAPSYPLMILSRFLSGLPHGAFFGVGTVVASELGGKGKEARYISLMFTGLTVANLVMVPLVTYIGHEYHWRWYFAIVSLTGIVALIFLKLWLPAMENKNAADNFSKELEFLKNKQSWYVLIITSIGFGGLFAWLSYITPLMTEVGGLEQNYMVYVMILAGLGMVVGNLAGGYLSDKFGAAKTNAILLLAMTIALLGVFFFSSNKVAALILTFLCGGLSMSIAAPINIMMLAAAPRAKMMSAAFIQAAFNMANALGAYLGGIPLEYGLSYNYPAAVGVIMSFMGFLIVLMFINRYEKKPKVQPIHCTTNTP